MKSTHLKFFALAALCIAFTAAQAVGLDPASFITPEMAMGISLAGSALTTKYVQPGNVIQYTAGADIAAGTVVPIGNILGVALNDIANGSTGPVMVNGVFTVPKVTGAVIAQGESLVWDVSAGKFDDNAATPATGDISGPPAVAFEAAGNGVTSLAVKFTGVPGTKT